MPVNVIQEQAQDNTLLPNVYMGKYLFAFHSHPDVNEQVSPPTVAAPDVVAKTVATTGHFSVECNDKCFVPI
jgi:hypothetical protein